MVKITNIDKEKLILGLRSDHDAKRFKPAKPNLFSFNSPQGACPSCRGFGKTILIDENKTNSTYIL